jgi:hypothetical protein
MSNLIFFGGGGLIAGAAVGGIINYLINGSCPVADRYKLRVKERKTYELKTKKV